MVILVPWKPVALVLGVLSALILVMYRDLATCRRASCREASDWCAPAAFPLGCFHQSIKRGYLYLTHGA